MYQGPGGRGDPGTGRSARRTGRPHGPSARAGIVAARGVEFAVPGDAREGWGLVVPYEYWRRVLYM
ncbi:hypothetical protein [Streptomyces albicerus]|uniref:hypothetical protein n=1 Tax=Streptomyces albicerus TaxID=2569859 RepID=UPI00124B3CF3|nr:hypothetical protein [Streptomyces albicerus]